MTKYGPFFNVTSWQQGFLAAKWTLRNENIIGVERLLYQNLMFRALFMILFLRLNPMSFRLLRCLVHASELFVRLPVSSVLARQY